jgi:hypothetical protein
VIGGGRKPFLQRRRSQVQFFGAFSFSLLLSSPGTAAGLAGLLIKAARVSACIT